MKYVWVVSWAHDETGRRGIVLGARGTCKGAKALAYAMVNIGAHGGFPRQALHWDEESPGYLSCKVNGGRYLVDRVDFNAPVSRNLPDVLEKSL